MPGRAAIYCRISKDSERTRLGVERQEKECREICTRHGLGVVSVYVDNDISAYSGARRPGFEDMKTAMKNGEFDVLVAWHPDRLTRAMRELEDLIELIEVTGVSVNTVTAGEYRLDTSAGRQLARILGAVARGESEHKAERIRSKLDELAAAGKPAAGQPPYGYRRENPERARGQGRLVVVPEEADNLRWMAEQVLSGRSLNVIKNDLNLRGVPTKRGVRWHHTTVSKVLTNPAIAGLRVHRREIAGPAEHEPIFERAEWEMIRATIQDPARKRTRPARKYILAGLVESEAGDPMNGAPDISAHAYRTRASMVTEQTPDGPRTTQVAPRVHTSIRADRLEEFVVEQVLIALEDWRPTAPAEEASPAAKDVARLEGELAELADLRGRQVISMQEWLAARTPLTAALEHAKNEASSRRRPQSPLHGATNIREAWAAEDLTIEQKRQVIATVVDKVVVSRSTRGRWATMEERVRIKWKA